MKEIEVEGIKVRYKEQRIPGEMIYELVFTINNIIKTRTIVSPPGQFRVRLQDLINSEKMLEGVDISGWE